jgi:hypothetical protein
MNNIVPRIELNQNPLRAEQIGHQTGQTKIEVRNIIRIIIVSGIIMICHKVRYLIGYQYLMQIIIMLYLHFSKYE